MEKYLLQLKKFTIDVSTPHGLSQAKLIAVVQFAVVGSVRGYLWFSRIGTIWATVSANYDPSLVSVYPAIVTMSIFNALLQLDGFDQAVKWLRKKEPVAKKAE